MRLRDAFIGGLVSLVVTIASGLAVYYATKEPEYAKTERIQFSLSQPAVFDGGAKVLAFNTVKLVNLGGIPAKNVLVNVSLKDAELEDVAIVGGAQTKEVERKIVGRNVSLRFGAILPGETIVLNILQSKAEKPKIEVRSDLRLGEEVSDLIADERLMKSSRLDDLSFLLKTALGAGTFLSLILLVLTKFGAELFPSRNNTGFLLLHSGLSDEADKVFEKAILNGSSDQYTLSNQALCKAVMGNLVDAAKLLRAAQFREHGKHAKAVVSFNEGLISLLAGDRTAALVSLQKALDLSPARIKNYCERSVHLDIVRSDPAFAALF